MSGWPHRSLAAVPGEHIALRLAEEVRRLVAHDREECPCDLDRICVLGGFRSRIVVLDTRLGGHEALLVPKVDGGFEILVDPTPSVGQAVREEGARQRLSRRRLRFRIAHEVGHSFFYDRQSRPARRLLTHSDAEEVFCDAFANALLVPPHAVRRRAPTGEAVFDLAHKFDVSVETAGRAVAKAHPGVLVLGVRPTLTPRGTVSALFVLWSAGRPLFPTGAELTGAWVDLTQRDGDDEGELDLGGAHGKVRMKVARPSESYWVISLVPAGRPTTSGSPQAVGDSKGEDTDRPIDDSE